MHSIIILFHKMSSITNAIGKVVRNGSKAANDSEQN